VDDDGSGADDGPAADASSWGHPGTDPDQRTLADGHVAGEYRTWGDVGDGADDALVLDHGTGVDDRPLADGRDGVDDRSGHDEAPVTDGRGRRDESSGARSRDESSADVHRGSDEPLARVVGAHGDEHGSSVGQKIGKVGVRADDGDAEPAQPVGRTNLGGRAPTYPVPGLAEHLDADQGMSTGTDDEHRRVITHAPTVASRSDEGGGESGVEYAGRLLLATAMVEVAVLVAVLVGASAFGFWRLRADGRMKPHRAAPTADPFDEPDPASPQAVGARPTLTSEEIGHPLGERATLVQFSSAFCAPCRATRQVLAGIAEAVPGVTHVEVDAESHLDLVRRLDIRRTPTTLVLDASGREIRRAAGVPRNDEVLAVLGEAVA
jgi:thiol-disulfide isomerase/thioredoxin